MHQNTENVQAELKECLMISAHEVNFQTSSSRRRKYSFKISFMALQRSSLVTTDEKIVCSYNQPARIMESQYLTWKPRLSGMQKYQIFDTQAYIFLLKSMFVYLMHYIRLFFES